MRELTFKAWWTWATSNPSGIGSTPTMRRMWISAAILLVLAAMLDCSDLAPKVVVMPLYAAGMLLDGTWIFLSFRQFRNETGA